MKKLTTENGQLRTVTPTIGLFDSGFGGLTVLRALLPLIPDANYLYLGDTARLPYGSKSRDTIARYAVESAKFLHDQGAELLVIACNTATALALEDIQRALPIPVIGVVEPGAHAALSGGRTTESPQNRVPHLRDSLIVAKVGEAPQPSDQTTPKKAVILSAAKAPCISLEPQISPQTAHITKCHPERSGAESKDLGFALNSSAHVLVLATQATVQSRAYTRALNALNLEAYEKACPLLVPLVEEGWVDHPVTDEVLKIYLTEALTAAPSTQTLLLGCTHYPLIEPAIRRVLNTLNHQLTIIDSAQATAHTVAVHLAFNYTKDALMARTTADSIGSLARNKEPEAKNCRFYATDSIEKFERLGSAFLGQPVIGVRHVDLGG